MEISIYKDYQVLSLHAAERIIEQVKQKPDAVLCLAAGDTPRLAYDTLTKKAANEKLDFSKCTFVGLDEWVGIPPGNEGSCHYFLKQHLIGPLKLSADRIHLFDALSNDLDHECRKMNALISTLGGIDLMMVGIGMNGHIGFNEPGASPDLYAHVVELDEATRTVGQKYFRQQTPLAKGITLGLKHLLESRKAILIANGTKKAGVIQQALKGPVTPDLPATIMRQHANSEVMLDEEAAESVLKC